MKRFHVHVAVADLAESIRFYSGLFGAPPVVRKPDYAKWMIDDPRVNFAISERGNGRKGINHLGLQADSAEELAGIRAGFEAADAESIVHEPNVSCCYARSNKHWVTDPQGIAWEGFHSLDTVPMHDGASAAGSVAASGCCAPADETAANACCGSEAAARSDTDSKAAKSAPCCA